MIQTFSPPPWIILLMYIFNPGDRVVDQMTWFKSRNCLLWLFGSAGVKFVRLLGIRVLTYEWTLFRSRCKFPEVYYEVYPRKHVSLGWRLLGCGCVFKLGYHWMVNLTIRLYFDWAQVLTTNKCRIGNFNLGYHVWSYFDWRRAGRSNLCCRIGAIMVSLILGWVRDWVSVLVLAVDFALVLCRFGESR